MKDLIIGCSTNYDWSILKYWVNSINRSGFQGDKVLIVFNCNKETVEELIKNDFTVIGLKLDENKNFVHQSSVPVHVERFIHIYNYMKNNNYRYAITTDVKDVIFQKNPIDYIEQNIGDKNLIFSSESMLYKDEPWGDKNLLETYGQYIHDRYKNNEIYNVGVLAGKASAIRDLSISIFAAALGRPIPICDQSTFNFMVSMHPYTDTSLYTKSEDGWACQLGTTGDPSKLESFKPNHLEPIPKYKDDKVYTSTDDEFYIVHQYDRVPELRRLIEAKYG